LAPRKRVRTHEEPSSGALDFLDLLDELVIVLLVAAAVIALLIFFVLPALLFVLQLLIFFALLFLTVFLRVVLHRPWIVEAFRVDGRDRKEWAVMGWWRSRRVIDEVAQGISLGHRLIEPEGAHRVTSVAPKS